MSPRTPHVTYDQSDGWHCGVGDDEQQGVFTIEPGQTETVPVWFIVYNAVSNSHPTFTSVEFNNTVLGLESQADQLLSNQVEDETAAGPDAVDCGSKDESSYDLNGNPNGP